MNPNGTTGHIIKKLREERGMTQKEFGFALAEFMDRHNQDGSIKEFNIMTISSWEKNIKLPPADTFIWLARYFGVTTDYLYGLTSERHNQTYDTQPFETYSTTSYPIHFSELKNFDGMPVYVVLPDGYKGYFLVDISRNAIVGKDIKYRISSKFTFYKVMPLENITIQNKKKKLLSLPEMMDADYVMIESLSQNPYIRGLFNGVYHHFIINGMKKFLIDQKGNTLDYSGLGTTFNAIEYK